MCHLALWLKAVSKHWYLGNYKSHIPTYLPSPTPTQPHNVWTGTWPWRVACWRALDHLNLEMTVATHTTSHVTDFRSGKYSCDHVTDPLLCSNTLTVIWQWLPFAGSVFISTAALHERSQYWAVHFEVDSRSVVQLFNRMYCPLCIAK